LPDRFIFCPLLTIAFQLQLPGFFRLFFALRGFLIRRLLPDTAAAAIFLFASHAHHLLSVID
jgi:hypothetical protein